MKNKQIRIRKGLTINLKGKPSAVVENLGRSSHYAVKPTSFLGVNPRLYVQPGDKVKAGDKLFYSKYVPQVHVSSPVSGTVKEIVRGKRRVILRVVIEADAEDTYVEFTPKEATREDVLQTLLHSGLFAYIKQRPYDITANPADKPKAIYIPAYDTSPLAPDYNFGLTNERKAFEKGVEILGKLTDGKVYVTADGESSTMFDDIPGAETLKIYGPHPAGNVSVAIAHTLPISQGDRIWVVNPWDVVIMGRLFLTGRYDATKHVAFTGPLFKEPRYYKVKQGAYLKDAIGDLLKRKDHVRLVSGNPLTGTNITEDGFLDVFDNSITALSDEPKARFFGWLPFLGESRKTVYRLNADWWSNKERELDTALYGEERPFVMTEEIEEVMPLDIFPVQLLKACLTGNVDRMEQLGILEVAPEDFALVDYISSSKINAQNIIRNGLDIMMVEIG